MPSWRGQGQIYFVVFLTPGKQIRGLSWLKQKGMPRKKSSRVVEELKFPTI
jgi:hypothetical protein